MAATHVLPAFEDSSYDESSSFDRQAMIDSVLGTMEAEGEPPSDVAKEIMRRYVAGEISHSELSEAILSHAARMVDEANARRLAV
jgi:hypothetical protein